MRASAILWVFIALQTVLWAAQDAPVTQPKPPTLPFIERGACPFEGCQYGPWTATKPASVYDTWNAGRKQIARISKGEKVTGVTGLVITFKPGVIRMDRDVPEFGLKRGNKILTYTYHGEGTSAVWFNRQFYKDFDLSFAKWSDGGGCSARVCAATVIELGKNVWWAEVKLADGRMGWVNMNEAAFNGVDALA